MKKTLLTLLLAGAITACTPALDKVNVKSIDSIVSTNLYAQAEKKQARYVELNDSNYKSEVLDYKGPCIVMFYDSNCERAAPSCRMKTVMDALMQQYGEQIKFCLYDVVPNNEKKNLTKEQIAKKMKDNYSVEAYPTTVMVENGKEVDRKKNGPNEGYNIKKWVDWYSVELKKDFNI